MHEHRLGRTIGGATGGNLRGINGGAFFVVRLPSTGPEVDLPWIGYYPRGPLRPDAGLEPDLAVAETIEDIAAGRDREWGMLPRKLSFGASSRIPPASAISEACARAGASPDVGGIPVYEDPTSNNFQTLMHPSGGSCLVQKPGALVYSKKDVEAEAKPWRPALGLVECPRLTRAEPHNSRLPGAVRPHLGQQKRKQRPEAL